MTPHGSGIPAERKRPVSTSPVAEREPQTKCRNASSPADAHGTTRRPEHQANAHTEKNLHLPSMDGIVVPDHGSRKRKE
jgi:hypothetical protein